MFKRIFNDIDLTILAATVVLLLFVSVIIIIFLWYDKNKRMNREKLRDIEMKNQEREARFQQEIIKTQMEIQEQTLKLISQEIHDNIGQVLSLAKLNLNTIDLQRQQELVDKINESKQLVAKAIQDLRDLSRSFNTDSIAAMGLQRAIAYQLDLIRKSNYETRFEINGEPFRMDPRQELIIFRIIQESINNIIRHARATRIIINATYSPGGLQLQVSDNGEGIQFSSPGLSGTPAGLGIRNMETRAKMIQAVFNLHSVVGEGTTITLFIPAHSKIIQDGL